MVRASASSDRRLRRRIRGAAQLALELITVPRVRRSWILRLRRPANLFQPHNDTEPDRYPDIFRVLQANVDAGPDARLLSFGCSVGDEVFSLRTYFPAAAITGIDISRGNIADCRRRLRRLGDPRIRFVRAGDTTSQPDARFDAILCMAVFRHGDLGELPTEACDHRIRFEAFDQTVGDLARCLKIGGHLVIEHSNFRFRDTSSAGDFVVVTTRDLPPGSRVTPLFGPDNRRLEAQTYRDVVFRKMRHPGLPTLQDG